MKKLIAILLTILICGIFSISSAEAPLRVQPGDSGTEWRIKSKTADGTTTSGSEQFYSSYPVKLNIHANQTGAYRPNYFPYSAGVDQNPNGELLPTEEGYKTLQ